MAAPPKLHHYVPQTYLRQFTRRDGRVFVYRKDDPANPHPRLPRETGAQNNYYAQPLADGTLDRGLEAFFQRTETLWPSIVHSLSTEGQLPNDLVEPFYEFLGAIKVRGPVSRDAAELMLAEQVRAAGKIMQERGDLPVPPPGLEDILDINNLVLSIDPHQSIHAMPYLLKGFARVLDLVGFSLVRNDTRVDLITSDNPISYFDASAPEADLKPYAIESGPPVELIFPITPRLLLVGHSDWIGPKSHSVFRQLLCRDPQVIKRANRFTARFAYKEIYAVDRAHDDLVRKWADKSPVVHNKILDLEDGNAVISQWVFGSRPLKPKWTGETRAD